MATIEPTLRNRIPTYDVLRGVAVLGILLANIHSFSGPIWATMMGVSTAPPTEVEASAMGWTMALVTGKFRSLLAVLFGVGVYLQYRKRSAVPGNWPGGYMKRMAWLGAFGLAHGFLLWYGDILFLYSLIGFVACLFVTMQERVIRWIAGVVFAGASLLAFATTGLMLLFANSGDEFGGGMEFFSEESEIAVYQAGSYLEQLGLRSAMFAMMLVSSAFLVPAMFPLFLLGMLLGRSGALICPSAHPRLRRWLLGLGLGVGLPLNLVGIGLGGSESWFAYSILWEMTLGPLLSLGYLMVLAIWAESGSLRWLQEVFAKVGRTALSCYLMQTLLCTFAFYSWGLGLFARLEVWQTYVVVVLVWAANVAFAHLWLRRFSIGPFEWLWRSLTEGRRVAWR